MAIPIIKSWRSYFDHPDEGLGSSYERIILNKILLACVDEYQVQSVLESPCFGFTGLSGINLLALAKKQISVQLEDHDEERIGLIKELWQSLNLSAKIRYNPDYRVLNYPDQSFDMSFSFSALWFCQELPRYLEELARVSKKCIFISVPNRSGLGYKSQLQDYDPQVYPQLKISHIDPASFIHILSKLGWSLKKRQFFDCPLWPDIGMSKEEFLSKKLKINLPTKVRNKQAQTPALNILGYYQDKDPSFEAKMLRYSLLERYATAAFKRIWAHHEYFVFEPVS